MYYLLYESVAKPTLNTEDLAEILHVARKVNEERDITGYLLYVHEVGSENSKASFYQVLEGAENDVQEIYSRIKQDERHSEVTLLEDGEIGQRNFGNWSMELKIVSGVSLHGKMDVEKMVNFSSN